MPVPILVYVCFFASFASSDLLATKVEVDNDHIAVIIPVTTKDRAFTVNVFREKDEDFAITPEDAFDQDAVVAIEQTPVDEEKKTTDEEPTTK